MFAKSKPNMNVSSDQKSRDKLAGCVYEYLNFIGAKKAAEQFLREVPMDTSGIQLNEPPGFLASWWFVFWDLYNAAPERRMSNDHSMEARAYQDYLNPNMPYPMGQPGMPPGSNINMGGLEGHPNFYPMGPNAMRPPLQQSQGPMGQMPQMGGMPQQQGQQQQVMMGGPRYPPRPGMRMEIAPGVPPQQQNMNPAMHRVSPGAARIPGSGAPNAAPPYGMQRPGMPPQNSGPMPMGMPHNQAPRPWPPVGGNNVAPGPSAYSTPPPGSIPPGYPPLTPSNNVPSQLPNVNAQGMLASPVQEMPPNGTDIYTNGNNQMGLSLQRMPSAGQMQPSYMPGQNMDMMNNSQSGGGMSQAPTPLQVSRGGPQTPQSGMPMNSDQMSGLMNGNGTNGDGMNAMNKASHSNGKGHPNSVADQNQSNPQQDMGNPGGDIPFNMFPNDMEEDEAIKRYKQLLQDDVQKQFEITPAARNQLTPGSSGPNSVQAQQQSATNGGGAPGGLERPLSSGGVNGGPADPSQAGGMGGASVSDYLFQG